MKNQNETQTEPENYGELQQINQNKPDSWLRQPDEPAKYYLLFKIYLNLSLKRTFPMVAKTTGMSTRTLKRIAAKYNWRQRVDEYDIYNYEEKFKEISELVGYYNERKIQQQIEISGIIQGLVDGMKPYLYNFHDYLDKPDTIKKLKYVKNVSKMLTDMIKMTDFSVSKVMKEGIVNEMEIANILKGAQDPDFFTRNLPEELKGQYKNALEKLARKDKFAQEELQRIELEKHNGKTLKEELADLLNEVVAGDDEEEEDDLDDVDYDDIDDEEEEDEDDDVDEEDVDFDNMTEAEIKHYLSLDPDKTLKPVPENHPEQFNYEAFHAKLVEMEERRAAYDNWKNGKKMKKGDRR